VIWLAGITTAHIAPPPLTRAPLPPPDLSVFYLELLTTTARGVKRGKAPGYLGDSPDLLIDIADRTISALPDVAFIFAFLTQHGPPLGLVLSPDKCSILLSTTAPLYLTVSPSPSAGNSSTPPPPTVSAIFVRRARDPRHPRR
jgi:hypothetical protein